MKILGLSLVLACAAPPVLAEPMQRGDQVSAYRARQSGRLLPLPEIERRGQAAVPGAQYLGFDFDGSAGLYTLKFLRDGTVIWVEVDGRTGQILGRTGR